MKHSVLIQSVRDDGVPGTRLCTGLTPPFAVDVWVRLPAEIADRLDLSGPGEFVNDYFEWEEMVWDIHVRDGSRSRP